MTAPPGGLSVFEDTLMVLLGSYLPVDRLLAALLLYRLVYYVGPLTLALLVPLADEIRSRRMQLARVGMTLGAYSVQLAPRVLALFTFMAGLLLLFSGATPVEHKRLYLMARLLPVGLFEASHFLGSIVGVGLLVLAQAVVRRLQVAYYLVLAGLLAGIITSLLKAAIWEEAILLSLLLFAFVSSRGFFVGGGSRRRPARHRRAAGNLAFSRLPARQSTTVQCRSQRIRHVRRTRTNLGGVGRSGRSGRSGRNSPRPDPGLRRTCR